MKLRTSSIIHAFALLHVATAVLCRLLNLGDELALTTLTIVLTVILCLRYRQSVEFSSIVIIIANILGYLLGNGIAALAGTFINHPLLSPAIATFTTTESMGWGLVFFMRRYADRYGKESKARSFEITWLSVAVAIILIVRIIIYIFSSTLFEGGSVVNAVAAFADNTFILLVMVCLTILFVEQTKNMSDRKSSAGHILATAVFLIALPAVAAALVGSGLPFEFRRPSSAKSFLELALVAFIAEVMIYSVIYMIEYAITARRNAEKEKDRADLAKFQYLNLKQQVNPHFLFNSLNILDALVLDGRDREASEYIHKLAGIYRYMLPVPLTKEQARCSGAQEGRFRSRRVIDAVMVGRQSAAGSGERAAGSGERTAGNEQRRTSSGERAAGNEQRAAGNELGGEIVCEKARRLKH